MASTKESVRVLRRRSAEILSRSGGGGSDDSGRANVSGTAPNNLSSSTYHLPRGTEAESSPRNDNNTHPVNHNNGETLVKSIDVRAISDVQHELQAPPNSTVNTHLFVGEETNVLSGDWPSPALAAQNRAPTTNGDIDGVVVVSDPSGAVVNVNQTCTRPVTEVGQGLSDPNEIRLSQAVNEGGVEAKTSSTKIADVLAALPLSKVKIVIGEPISKVIYL